MIALLALILLIAGLTMISWVLFGLLDNIALPMRCPACWLRTAADSWGAWHERDRRGVLRCRACKTSFLEQTDGSIIPEPPSAP